MQDTVPPRIREFLARTGPAPATRISPTRLVVEVSNAERGRVLGAVGVCLPGSSKWSWQLHEAESGIASYWSLAWRLLRNLQASHPCARLEVHLTCKPNQASPHPRQAAVLEIVARMRGKVRYGGQTPYLRSRPRSRRA